MACVRSLPALRRCLRETAGSAEARVDCTRGRRPLGHSLYGVTVPLWRRHFADLLVLKNEDLAAAPRALMQRVEAHLGLPPRASWDDDELHRRYNPSACARGRAAANREATCGGRNNTSMDLASVLEMRRPGWWETLEAFYREPGHQLEGFEYL